MSGESVRGAVLRWVAFLFMVEETVQGPQRRYPTKVVEEAKKRISFYFKRCFATPLLKQFKSNEEMR